MLHPRFSLALVAALALSACTDPDQYTENPKDRTIEGAALGAITGALAGGSIGPDGEQKAQNAVAGALVGAVAGSFIGSQLDRQAQQLEQSFGNDRIKVTNTGDALIVTMPQDILFATDSATLSPALRGDLRILAGSLNEFRSSTVDVIGHTDNTGSAAYNLTLSQQRAQSVVEALVANGVRAARFRAIGRGEDRPVATNQTAEGRALNRRVDIVIRPVS